MSTVQNYVGGGNYATSTDLTADSAIQTANSTAELSSTVDNWQPDPFLENSYKALHGLIDDFLNEAGASGPVELINELMLSYLHEAIDLSEGGPYQQYTISGTHLTRILNVTQLVQFLVKLGETWQHIKRREATVE